MHLLTDRVLQALDARAQTTRETHAVPDPPLLVVVGPTASGKTALAIALAEALGGEIVSADSVQIYRAFDIGSGKPTDDERRRAAHHLVDAIDPLEPMDAARFVELADQAIAGIRARGRRPIVCGGTYLWTRALLHGLAPAAAKSDELRARHIAIAEAQGAGALHAELSRVDPESAARLHPNDRLRVSRALEVHELTGRRLSEWQAEHGFRETRYPALRIGVSWPAEELTRRIAQRVDGWLVQGWVDEVRRLVDSGYGQARAMSSVGYRQVKDHLDGRLPQEELALSIVRATRIFARRQRTWLRDEDVLWLDLPSDASTT